MVQIKSGAFKEPRESGQNVANHKSAFESKNDKVLKNYLKFRKLAGDFGGDSISRDSLVKTLLQRFLWRLSIGEPPLECLSGN